MIPILYPYNEIAFTTRGYGALTTCSYCQITESLNGEYTLELRCFYNDYNTQYLLPRNIILVQANQTQTPQAFRIYKVSRPINNTMTVYARHISYDLSGYQILPGTSASLSAAITRLNNAAGDFTITTDKTSSTQFVVDVPSSVRSWFGGKEGSLIDLYGGEWLYDNFSCQLLAARGENRGVRINYGVNMSSYLKEAEDNQYSHVIAYYNKENNGTTTVRYSSAVATGVTDIQRTYYVDATDQYPDSVPTTAQLTTFATSYVSAHLSALVNDSQTITVTPELIGTQTIALGDTVLAIYGNEAHSFRAIKTVWDALLERYTSIELGTKKTTIAETIKSLDSPAVSYGGGDENVIETVKVNGTALTVSNKAVNIPLATTSADGVMSSTDKTSLDALATATTLTSGFFTAESGLTVRVQSLRKWGNMIQLSLGINKSTAFGNARTTLGTLATAYRPSAGIAFASGASTSANGYINRVCGVVITTAGVISADTQNATDVKEVRFLMTYMV